MLSREAVLQQLAFEGELLELIQNYASGDLDVTNSDLQGIISGLVKKIQESK
jgi:hypothetical protein